MNDRPFSSKIFEIRKSTDDWPCFVSVLLSGSLLTLVANITNFFGFVTPLREKFINNCHNLYGDTKPNPCWSKALSIFCVALTNPDRPWIGWGGFRATAPTI